MIVTSDIFIHIIPQKDMQLIWDNTREAQKAFSGLFMNGKSQFREKTDRKSYMSEDQLVGQISAYCGSAILTGSINGYIKAREKANANPDKGDGGTDIYGLDNIDIKGSMMRYSQDPLKYRLLLREKERHKNGIYVLSLVPKERPYKSFLVGWATDDDLPKETYTGDIKPLHGAYVLEAKNLRKIKDLIN